MNPCYLQLAFMRFHARKEIQLIVLSEALEGKPRLPKPL